MLNKKTKWLSPFIIYSPLFFYSYCHRSDRCGHDLIVYLWTSHRDRLGSMLLVVAFSVVFFMVSTFFMLMVVLVLSVREHTYLKTKG